MIALPMSVSIRGLEHHTGQLVFKRCCKLVDLFDHIFVRGPYSYAILRNYCNIKEEKLDIRPDTGFYLRKLFPSKVSATRDRIRIAIVPRTYLLDNPEEQLEYLSHLSRFIRLLSQKRDDIEIYLTSLAFKADYSAMMDLIRLLKTRTPLLRIEITKLGDLSKAWDFYNKMDIIITSRMHDGIIGMSASKPVLIVFPHDAKIFDILYMLHLDTTFYLVPPNTHSLSTELLKRTLILIDDYRNIKKGIKTKVERIMPSLESLATDMKNFGD
jgi:polysaccharide pyruvyl transferase WcaK-like protein